MPTAKLLLEKKPHSVDKRQKARDKEQNWREVCRQVRKRDGNACRACGHAPMMFNPVDPHHIKFKSAGGGDTTRNVACMCRSCHDEVHAYRLAVVGDNANKALRFVRRNT